MDIPSHIRVNVIQDSLDTQTLYLFKNTTYNSTAPGHYHIVMKTNDSSYFVLTMFTTQVSKKKILYQHNPQALSSLIELDAATANSICSNLNNDSCIDCNQATFKTSEELSSIIDMDSLLYIEASLNNTLMTEIKTAIKNSPLIRPYHQKLLDDV